MVTVGTNQKFKEGTVFFEKGQVSNHLFVVHEGSVEYLDQDDQNIYKIIQMSGKNFTPGVSTLFTEGNIYPYKAVASSDALVSVYAMKENQIRKGSFVSF